MDPRGRTRQMTPSSSVRSLRKLRATVVLIVLTALAVPLAAETSVTLLHFSDYHSQAIAPPGERGGIARAIGYLQREKRRGAFVFSGGDMVNKGTPAWSDKYRCVEWNWLNGIVDAMAFGNHEADYGKEVFEQCRASVTYPILAANLPGLPQYTIVERDGIRIGVFAVAGPDFPRLVHAPGFSFGDSIGVARDVVSTLRNVERVHAIVMIGHEHAEDDYDLAAAIPGIDVVFGSHSHLERPLVRIPSTDTWFISAGHYLEHISRVILRFEEGRLTAVSGELVPVDGRMRENRTIARRVAKLQKALERDPLYRANFRRVASLESRLDVPEVAKLALEAMRRATGAEVALSTMSSFRRSLPAGAVTMEMLRGALPYDNQIVTCSMPGFQLRRMLDFSHSRAGSDAESYHVAPESIDPSATYRIATTDYLATVAYTEVFTCDHALSGLRVRDELLKALTRGER